METINLFGLKLNKLSYELTEKLIADAISSHQKIWIATPNPEIWLKAKVSDKYLSVLNQADLSIADGIGLTVAYYYQNICAKNLTLSRYFWGRLVLWLVSLVQLIINKSKISANLNQVSGDVLFHRLLKLSVQQHWRIYILGGSNQMAQIAKQKIINTYHLEIDSDSGSQDIKNENQVDKQTIINKINKFQPNILFVAYGAPWQELWISENLSNLQINLAIGIGGTIDEYAKGVSTPDWMRAIGLRWLWRLYVDPKRFIRIFQAIFVFSFKIIKEK